jgi:hypothetical protein
MDSHTVAGATTRAPRTRSDGFLTTFWGVIVRPRATLQTLATHRSIRLAVIAVIVSMSLTWANMIIFWAAGQDWLGTREQLAEPTYVGFFGYLRVGTEYWVPIFAVLVVLLGVLTLVVLPGLVQLLSKLWHGIGSFEQMVNMLTFAVVVPTIVIRQTAEILFGVPVNLITGQQRWWTAAMGGELGPVTEAVWNTFVIGVYTIGFDVWVLTLGTIAIRRVQRIPLWAAALVMIVSYVLWMYGIEATFVR